MDISRRGFLAMLASVPAIAKALPEKAKAKTNYAFSRVCTGPYFAVELPLEKGPYPRHWVTSAKTVVGPARLYRLEIYPADSGDRTGVARILRYGAWNRHVKLGTGPAPEVLRFRFHERAYFCWQGEIIIPEGGALTLSATLDNRTSMYLERGLPSFPICRDGAPWNWPRPDDERETEEHF